MAENYVESVEVNGVEYQFSDHGKLPKDGDGSNVTAAFSAAEKRENIATGEKLSEMLGKIARWLGDLGTLAFRSSVAKSDLAAAVQTSLNKADTALQGYTETDPTVPGWAKAAEKPTYTAIEVGAVPTSRKVNGKALSANVTLGAGDVGAVPTSRTVNGRALSANITLGAVYTATLTAAGWTTSGGWKTQTVSVTGLKASYNAAPFMDVSLTGTDATGDAEIAAAWLGISASATASTAANSLTVKFPATADTPAANIPVRITTYD